MLKFHPYSILTGDTRVEFVIYCVLRSPCFILLPPIMTSSLSTYAKATFLENAFPRKKSRRSRKPIFTVWFFYTLEVWRNFAQGLPFFPQRTIVWNHFWKSILISGITCIHDITLTDKMFGLTGHSLRSGGVTSMMMQRPCPSSSR